MNPERFHKRLSKERHLLLKRLSLLNLLELFHDADAKDFYDDSRDEIAEPYRSLLMPFVEIADIETFAETIKQIHNEKPHKNAATAKSKRKRVSKNRPQRSAA